MPQFNRCDWIHIYSIARRRSISYSLDLELREKLEIITSFSISTEVWLTVIASFSVEITIFLASQIYPTENSVFESFSKWTLLFKNMLTTFYVASPRHFACVSFIVNLTSLELLFWYDLDSALGGDLNTDTEASLLRIRFLRCRSNDWRWLEDMMKELSFEWTCFG